MRNHRLSAFSAHKLPRLALCSPRSHRNVGVWWKSSQEGEDRQEESGGGEGGEEGIKVKIFSLPACSTLIGADSEDVCGFKQQFWHVIESQLGSCNIESFNLREDIHRKKRFLSGIFTFTAPLHIQTSWSYFQCPKQCSNIYVITKF